MLHLKGGERRYHSQCQIEV